MTGLSINVTTIILTVAFALFAFVFAFLISSLVSKDKIASDKRLEELKKNEGDSENYSLAKLAFIPLLMGVGYEFIKYAGKHDNLLVKILSAPGLWMQRLTTKEPTDDIIEVGIESLKAVITDNPEDDEIK